MLRLSAAVKCELVMAGIALLVAETDLRVPHLPDIWSLDASPSKGAFVKSRAGVAQAKELWRVADRKSSSMPLQGRAGAMLRELGLGEEEQTSVKTEACLNRAGPQGARTPARTR